MYQNKKTKIDSLSVMTPGNEIVLFDTETTGLGTNDRVVEIGAVKCHFLDDGSLAEDDRLHLYIKPTFPMPPKAAEVNGITDELLEDKPTISECYDEIKAFFGGLPVAAYNSNFDVRLMNQTLGEIGEEFTPPVEIDVMKMAKDFINDNDFSYKMCNVCSELGVAEGVHFHGALDDTLAMKDIADVFFKYYKFEEENPDPKVAPKVYGINYWNGPNHKLERIYIRTSMGKFYYDIYHKTWNCDKDNEMPESQIDWDSLVEQSFRIAGVTCETEFSSFRG